MSAAQLPHGGALQGRTHFFPLRVYYEDTDAAGIVYHANYLRFAERGRTEMLRAIGIELGAVQREEGLVFVVHKGAVYWRKPARIDDVLMVETSLTKLGRAMVSLRQVIRRPSGGDEIMHFDVDVACMDVESGKPTRVPPHLRDKFEPYVLNEV